MSMMTTQIACDTQAQVRQALPPPASASVAYEGSVIEARPFIDAG